MIVFSRLKCSIIPTCPNSTAVWHVTFQSYLHYFKCAILINLPFKLQLLSTVPWSIRLILIKASQPWLVTLPIIVANIQIIQPVEDCSIDTLNLDYPLSGSNGLKVHCPWALFCKGTVHIHVFVWGMIKVPDKHGQYNRRYTGVLTFAELASYPGSELGYETIVEQARSQSIASYQ